MSDSTLPNNLLRVNGQVRHLREYLCSNPSELRLFLSDKPSVVQPDRRRVERQKGRVAAQKAFLQPSENLTKSCNPPLPPLHTLESVEKAYLYDRYSNRYELQELARVAAPRQRVRSCCRSRLSGADHVAVKASADGYNYGNLIRCGSVWACPVCSAHIVVNRRRELADFIDRVFAAGHYVSMLTLTVPHGLGDDLEQSLDGLLGAFRKLQNRKTWRSRTNGKGFFYDYRLRGTVRTLEVTHGKNGWHPHLHVLLISEMPVDSSVSSRLLAMWQSSVIDSGLSCPNEHGVDIRQCKRSDIADYVQKWGIDYEMTGHNVKSGRKLSRSPFQILADSKDSSYNRKLFSTYADVFKGKRQLVYSKGLRNLYGCAEQLTDEELLEMEDQKAETIALIDKQGWKKLLNMKLRGAFLDWLTVSGGNVLETADLFGIASHITDLRDNLIRVPD